jgi:hypothetical protein
MKERPGALPCPGVMREGGGTVPALRILYREERFGDYNWEKFLETLIEETAKRFSTVERQLKLNAFGVIEFCPILPPSYLSKDIIAWFSHQIYSELLEEGNERARLVAEAMSRLLEEQRGLGFTVGVAVFLGETRWGSDLARHLEP